MGAVLRVRPNTKSNQINIRLFGKMPQLTQTQSGLLFIYKIPKLLDGRRTK